METRIVKSKAVSPAKKAGAPTPNIAKKRPSKLQIGIAIVLVALFGLWWMRPNPQVAKVREMRKDLIASAGTKMSPDERKQKFEALRAEEEKLPPDARKELRKEMGEQMQAKRSAEAIAYLKMSPAERRKVIDQKLAREKTMMQQPQKKGPAGPGDPGTMSVLPGAGVGAANGGPGGTGPSPESRDDRRRAMLIHVSPEARAGMDQMRADMASRRAQLGLATPSFGGKK